MGKVTGFMEYSRVLPAKRPVEERLKHYGEFDEELSEDQLKAQGARCMDCGIPFCHNGCPLGNVIPDWNDLVYRGRWEDAIEALHVTNNFPEFTGRICPAPCEESCVLSINDSPVTIKLIERNIIDHAWREGLIKPQPAANKTGKTVAVIGSGPAGMACAQQLARAGHSVTLFERSDRAGGLLRYGIPDFKMEKHLIDRRVEQMEAEGVTFRNSCNVGVDVTVDELKNDFDAIILSIGATIPRDLPVEGRDLDGIHFAMDFLPQQNKRVAGDEVPKEGELRADDKNVIVLGGGDTGSDCIGTSNRQGAKNIVQFEILDEPPERDAATPVWPYWPMILRTSTSHEEGVDREFAISTKRFIGKDGHVTALEAVRVEWKKGDDGRMQMQEVAGSKEELPADLVLLAMGFLGPQQPGLASDLGLEFDGRGNIVCDPNYMSTSEPGVFACGDSRRGQSLVVWAIWEGRECARAVDVFLMGESELPTSPAMAETGGRPV
jgi:glutamate synthase (NADPH/NADH) small chain